MDNRGRQDMPGPVIANLRIVLSTVSVLMVSYPA